MIKRDTLQRVVPVIYSNGSGGQLVSYNSFEKVNACVSVYATNADITQFGITEEYVIHTVSDFKLNEEPNTRYKWDDKLFKLLKQIRRGNEWFSTLKEVKN